MATTVTYKGQTLATVENQTKTLQTAGTWCEDDFTLTDVTQGGADNTPALIMDTLTSYSSTDVTKIRARAFSDTTNLKTVSLPNVTTCGNAAFQSATGLESLYLPRLTVIPGDFCRSCTKLSDYDFSEVTNLTNGGCFYQTALTGVYAPKCLTFGTWGNIHFAGCKSLLFFRAPIATGTCRQTCFDSDTALKLVDVGGIANFSAGNNFRNCTALEVLILRSDTVVRLIYSNDFTNVTQNVKVYVPSAIRASYASATNWSTLINNGILTFYDLEGSPYEDTDFVYMGVPA